MNANETTNHEQILKVSSFKKCPACGENNPQLRIGVGANSFEYVLEHYACQEGARPQPGWQDVMSLGMSKTCLVCHTRHVA